MNKANRLYCRIATVVFVVFFAYPVITKLLQERLSEDWLHSVLHLCSVLLGAYAGWYGPNIMSAELLTWAIGLLYFALGVYGWFTPRLLLGTPFAIPLGIADNVFHLVLSVPALAIVILDMSRSLQAAKASKRRRAHP